MTTSPRVSVFGRVMALTGGLIFAASLIYFLVRYAAFGESAGPWTSSGWGPAAADTLLFTAFALHHSVFARSGIKRRVAAMISESLERSTYVWIATLLFVLTLWAWLPIPGVLWQISGAQAWILRIGFVAGIALTAIAAAALDPLELAGIRQALGWPLRADRALSTTGAYGIVRHPIYLGWVLMVWCVPVMSGTRLVFAVVSTFYLVVAIPFEEREMRKGLGASYDDYARVVRWRMLPGLY